MVDRRLIGGKIRDLSGEKQIFACFFFNMQKKSLKNLHINKNMYTFADVI